MTRWLEGLPRYWEGLEEAMRATGQFRADRLGHIKLRQAFYAGRAVVRPKTDGYVPRAPIWAYAARLKTKDSVWHELSWFYVHKNKEGNGVLGEIVDELIGGVPLGINLFGITKSTATMRVFEKHGLQPITQAVMPEVVEWANAVGLGDWLPDTARTSAIPRPVRGERWLYIRKV